VNPTRNGGIIPPLSKVFTEIRSQREVADLLGVSHQAIAQAEIRILRKLQYALEPIRREILGGPARMEANERVLRISRHNRESMARMKAMRALA
jgi:hypothetical protein